MDRPFDPADPTSWASAWSAPLRSMFPNAFRYEGVDPRVQEIAILATMHNMASLLQDSEPLKSVISQQLAERAARLSKG